MARIDWAVLCDSAFLDRQDRLCVIGLVRKLTVPQLPSTIRQLMLVAHLVDIQPVDEVAIVVALMTPSGMHAAEIGRDNVIIEMLGDYVLAAFRDVPVLEEGVHHFQMKLRGQSVVSVQIPVLALADAATAPVH